MRKDFDLLPSLTQKRKGDPTGFRHLHLVLNLAQLLHERVGQLCILDTVISHLSELCRITLPKPSKHLFGWHIKLLIFQKVFRDIVQGIRLEFVFALHILKEVKDVPTSHRDHLELVVSESARTQVFLYEFRYLTLDAPPVGLEPTVDGCPHDEVLEIKPEYVPTCYDIWINFYEVLFKRLKKLLFGCEPFIPLRLLEAQALPIEIALLAKLLGGHCNLEDGIRLELGVWETPR